MLSCAEVWCGWCPWRRGFDICEVITKHYTILHTRSSVSDESLQTQQWCDGSSSRKFAMAGRPIEAGRKLAADIGIPLRPVHIAQPLFSEGVGVRALQSTCCADLRFIVSQLNDAVRKPAPDILPSPWILDKLGEVKDFFDLVTGAEGVTMGGR